MNVRSNLNNSRVIENVNGRVYNPESYVNRRTLQILQETSIGVYEVGYRVVNVGGRKWFEFSRAKFCIE